MVPGDRRRAVISTAIAPGLALRVYKNASPKLSLYYGLVYLLFGFTLARANARMLINAASKRNSAKNAVRTSRSRSTRMVAETE